MKKTIIYKYLGTNGILETPIHLEGIYSIKSYQLEADQNMLLTNGEKYAKFVQIPFDELNQWQEVSVGQN